MSQELYHYSFYFAEPRESSLFLISTCWSAAGSGLGPLLFSIYTHFLATLLVFNIIQMLMTPKFILSGSSSFAFQTHVIHCWLDISTWMSHRYHIFNLPKTESPPPFLWSHKIPHFRKWRLHSSSWLGSKPWNYRCLFFFPLSYPLSNPQKIWSTLHQNI